MSKIYVIGHKSPDLDSVAAAISYANFKNLLQDGNDYIPAIAGKQNRETAYLLDRFLIEDPILLERANSEDSYILVDHNEAGQSIDNMNEANIIEILDHHKVDFSYRNPIGFDIKPWGSSCSIIAQKYFDHNFAISKSLASLMLGAVLVDTVITKSPTVTDIDKEIIEKLSALAEIEDWKAYGMEIFKVRASVKDSAPEDIIRGDFKDFTFKAGKFGVGQVETVDLEDFKLLEDKIIEKLELLRKKDGYHTAILFITDIIKEGSKFLVATEDQAGFEKAFKVDLENKRVYIDGIISRKKQVASVLTEYFDK